MYLFIRAMIVGTLVLAVSLSSICQSDNARQSTPNRFDLRSHTSASQSQLIYLRDSQQMSQLRQHAWSIFAELTQPDSGYSDGVPIWDTWFTKRETLTTSPTCLENSARIRERTLQFPPEVLAAALANSHLGPFDSTSRLFSFFSDPGKSVLSEVLYNPAACQHIGEMKDLRDLRETLGKLSAPGIELEIPPFPSDSIVIKASWRRVPKEGEDSFVLWDSPTPSIQNCVAGCTRTIKVHPSTEKCQLSAAVIGTSCFYNIPVTDKNIRLFDSSEIKVFVGDVWVLVALHVITKEVPDWTWSTFWWHDKPELGSFGFDRPLSVRGFWRNYRMDTTLSMDTPWEQRLFQDNSFTGIDTCGQTWKTPSKAKIIFNPYLEGAVQGVLHMEYSNCMNCHSRSTFETPVGDNSGIPWRGFLSPTSPCFSSKMRLDYLWSLPHSSTDPAMDKLLNVLEEKFEANFKAR